MNTADIAAAAQRAVFEAWHRELDPVLLDTLLTRVGQVPYGGDLDTYVAVVTEVVRATLQPLIDRLTFACVPTSPTIH